MEEDIKKKYISPKYRFEEERNYDSGNDDDDEDYVDDSGDEDTEELENYLDNKDREETEKKKQLNNKFGGNFMQSTPFGQTFGNTQNNPSSSPWSTPGTVGSGWGNTGGSSWGQPNNNPWGQRTWGQSVPANNWGQTTGSTWGNASSSFKKESIDRTKKVIFCDFLDCLIETYQSNNRPGLIPRGIYDVRLKFEVWDKLRCFNAERIYIITPKFNLTSNNGLDCWTVLVNYVTCSLSDYLRVPYQNCQVLTQGVLGQPKKDVINYIISSPDHRIKRSDVLFIGLNSGFAGQSNIDCEAAEQLKIDYIDLSQLMSMYF